jgi:DNA modification methylase
MMIGNTSSSTSSSGEPGSDGEFGPKPQFPGGSGHAQGCVAPPSKTIEARNRGRTEKKLVIALNTLTQGDARALSKSLSDQSVMVTITSPPYFDMKDYGVIGQIGFGQDYGGYLDDLAKVFREIFRATVQEGSLWVVIDTFRRDKEVIPLPFDLVAKLRTCGWILRDVVIWKKERTVPWIQVGTTRRIFEYVLVFAKGSESFNYFPDTQRDVSELRKWWVKYPERYNPRGKALEQIWAFDIPTQGSWARKTVRHFCPLPPDLVRRIVSLTTQPGDLVLDPFAGTGTVAAEAVRAGRRSYGFELDAKHVRRFRKQRLLPSNNRSRPAKGAQIDEGSGDFSRTIKNLRVLKFARLLYRMASKHLAKRNSVQVYVRMNKRKPSKPFHICSADVAVLVRGKHDSARLRRRLESFYEVPPLSKFGVSCNLILKSHPSQVRMFGRNVRLFGYSGTNSHEYLVAGTLKKLLSSKMAVVSNICVKISQPDD